MAGVDGPEYEAGALGRPRTGKSRIGGEQCADLLRVALAYAIEDHASVSAEGRVALIGSGENLRRNRGATLSGLGSS